MKSSSFSAFPLLTGRTGFLEGSNVFWWVNKWARRYLLNLRLNICFHNDRSRGSSNNNTCSILCSLTVLIWDGADTCEAFSLTEVIYFILLILNYSWWYKIHKPRKTRKLSSRFNLSYLTKGALYFNAVSTIFKQESYICAPSLKLLVKISC